MLSLFLFLFNHIDTNDLVKKNVVNNEIIIPNASVTANPLIGPDPNSYKTIEPIKLVKFESIIVVIANLYP